MSMDPFLQNYYANVARMRAAINRVSAFYADGRISHTWINREKLRCLAMEMKAQLREFLRAADDVQKYGSEYVRSLYEYEVYEQIAIYKVESLMQQIENIQWSFPADSTCYESSPDPGY
uniref:Uncharacterized protein n=1 Tax=Bracon brevicornis TaxID=1563983 RepID=A0A6V7HZB2_9HYME